MKKSTIEYMAGVFDAEGCFNIGRSFRNDGRNCYGYFAQIIFTNTELKLLKWVVKHFGGVIKKRKLIFGQKQAYDWKVTNQKHALNFISLIYPHLVVKQQEAEIMIQYYKLNGKENPFQRSELFSKLKDLKKNKSFLTTEMPSISNPYLAGFFDGDGGICRPHSLMVCNTHKGIVKHFHLKYGGNFRENEGANKNQQNYFHWNLHNLEKVENVLLTWIPYLITKKQKSKELLNKIRNEDTV